MLQILNIEQQLLLNYILLIPIIGAVICFIVRPPNYYEKVGLLLSCLFHVPYLMLINIIAIELGWWTYAESANNMFGIPTELLLGWAIFWGLLLPYASKKLPILAVLIAALFIDLSTMPQLTQLFLLGDHWIIGEICLIAFCLLPAIIIFRLTAKRRRILSRSMLQSLIWGGWNLFLIPHTILSFNNQSVFDIFNRPTLVLVAFILCNIGICIVGYIAVWEFATKGRGTPIPFDPPQVLVKTGIYAFIRNPLQVTTLFMYVNYMLFYQSILMMLPIIALLAYCEFFVRWHHRENMEKQYGDEWLTYKQQVKSWIPSFRGNTNRDQA